MKIRIKDAEMLVGRGFSLKARRIRSKKKDKKAVIKANKVRGPRTRSRRQK